MWMKDIVVLLCHYEEFHPARVSFLESLSSILVIMKGYEKCIIVFAALTLRYVISLNHYSGNTIVTIDDE